MLLPLILLSMITVFLLGLCVYFQRQLSKRTVLLKYSHEAEKLLREDLKQLELQCRSALEDHVTGLPSWPVFEAHLTRVIKECERSHLIAGLLLIDINDFELLVDGLGTEGGHALLKEAADRVRQVLRNVDAASRYKNATFGVMMTQLAKPETAAIVAQRLLQVFAEPFYVDNRELNINASVGIAIYPMDGVDLEGLFQAAESAIKMANENGDHVYRFYQEKNQLVSQRELLIHMNVKGDSIFKELALYFQPVMQVETHSILCMDASLHWQHPELGLVDSQELYYHVEKQRKQNLFTEWLFKEACQQFVQWREFGFCPALLGIPISIKQLESTPFIYHLSQIMQACAFKPEWLLLELKDTSMASSFDILEKAFNMLNYLGVQLAVAHAGVTSFSFSCLRQVNVQYLILEQGFVDDIEHNMRTQAMVRGMKALTDNIGCQLIVRGVENENQAVILGELGCSYLQGRLMGESVLDSDVRMKMVPQV